MSGRNIGQAGTVARIAIGVLFIVLPVVFDYPGSGLSWWDAAAILLIYPGIAVGAASALNAVYQHRGLNVVNRTRAAWSASQAFAAAIVLAFVFAGATVLIFTTSAHRLSIFGFIGLSMVLAGVRGYDGCEILALPNTVLRRNDAIWCPLYTPIDAADRT